MTFDLLTRRCGDLRCGITVHFRPHSEHCPLAPPLLPESIPWDRPDADPLGDMRRILERREPG